MTRKFCPKCGETTDELFGSRGLCSTCYSDEVDILDIPDNITVNVCSTCGFYKVDHTWRNMGTEEVIFAALSPHLEEDVDVEIAYEEHQNTIALDVHVTKEMKNGVLRQTLKTNIQFKKEQCTTCHRYFRGYYTAIVQLRGELSDQALEDVLAWLEKRGTEGRKHFLSKIEEVRNGYDLYLSTRKLGEHLLSFLRKHYAFETKRSKTLYGRVRGREVYRETILCRITGSKA